MAVRVSGISFLVCLGAGMAEPICKGPNGFDWSSCDNMRPCSSGCSQQVCKAKIKNGTATNQCNTPYGQPGCDYGSDNNTCAKDKNGMCCYPSSDVPTPVPTPPPTPAYPFCSHKRFNWTSCDHHRPCHPNACEPTVCQAKIKNHTAKNQCVTPEGQDGCNYGTDDNTCAFDPARNKCCYSDTGLMVVV